MLTRMGVRGPGCLAQAFGDRFESAERGLVQGFSYDFDRVFGSMLIDEADSTGASHESSLPYYSPFVSSTVSLKRVQGGYREHQVTKESKLTKLRHTDWWYEPLT